MTGAFSIVLRAAAPQREGQRVAAAVNVDRFRLARRMAERTVVPVEGQAHGRAVYRERAVVRDGDLSAPRFVRHRVLVEYGAVLFDA